MRSKVKCNKISNSRKVQNQTIIASICNTGLKGMFMFEKNLISAYCNRLYDLGERHGLFSCNGQIKANSAGKNLCVTNINTKAGTPNRQIGLPLNSSFL